MNKISVKASREYNVMIGSGILERITDHLPPLDCGTKIVIVSDSNVWPIYGTSLTAVLEASGCSVLHFLFTAGEASKNAETYLQILHFLSENHVTRTDYLLALGGGVVGDLTGFAAATYLRGISYIQVPTSLLAMVDSSVGGKTAIDLPAGKNLVGAFYQPILVLCDIDMLKTLPTEYFLDGCAEVIKYGILFDEALFSHLEAQTLNFDREYVVCRCVELKRDTVLKDEFDNGIRQKLNLGHTLGHGIEAQSNYSVSHGRAVAIGTAIISRVAASIGICNAQTQRRICSILKAFGLPTETTLSALTLAACALSDKKRHGNTINLILPHEIGNCTIQPVSVDKFQTTIEAGL